MVQTLYEQFGVKETATPDEIKKAFRKLATKYHPDRNGGDKKSEAFFKQIVSTYEILSDRDLRSKYDAELKRSRDTNFAHVASSKTTYNSNTYGKPKQPFKQEYYEPKNEETVWHSMLVGLFFLIFLGFLLNRSTEFSREAPPFSNTDKEVSSFDTAKTGEIDFGVSEAKEEIEALDDMIPTTQSSPKSLIEELRLEERKVKEKQKDTILYSHPTGELEF